LVTEKHHQFKMQLNFTW